MFLHIRHGKRSLLQQTACSAHCFCHFRLEKTVRRQAQPHKAKTFSPMSQGFLHKCRRFSQAAYFQKVIHILFGFISVCFSEACKRWKKVWHNLNYIRHNFSYVLCSFSCIKYSFRGIGFAPFVGAYCICLIHHRMNRTASQTKSGRHPTDTAPKPIMKDFILF